MFTLDLTASIDYGTGVLQVPARLHQAADTRILITSAAGLNVLPMAWRQCFVSGMTSLGLELQRVQGMVISTSMDMSAGTQQFDVEVFQAQLQDAAAPDQTTPVSLRALLTNIPYWRHGSAGYPLHLSGFDLRIKPMVQGAFTHVLEAESRVFSDLPRFKEVTQALCQLCSFAAGRLCGVACVVVEDGGQILEIEADRVQVGFAGGRVVIKELADEADITAFVEHALSPYEALKAQYPLHTLIHLLAVAKHTSYLDNQTLLLANFLEVIRYNYALHVGVPAGTYRLDGEHFKHTAGTRRGKSATFAELLEAFCSDHGITRWETRFKDMRNEIIHTGTRPLTPTQWLPEYLDLEHFCDWVILALLDWDTVGGHYVPTNQERHPVDVTQLPDGREQTTFRFNRVAFSR